MPSCHATDTAIAGCITVRDLRFVCVTTATAVVRAPSDRHYYRERTSLFVRVFSSCVDRSSNALLSFYLRFDFIVGRCLAWSIHSPRVSSKSSVEQRSQQTVTLFRSLISFVLRRRPRRFVCDTRMETGRQHRTTDTERQEAAKVSRRVWSRPERDRF